MLRLRRSRVLHYEVKYAVFWNPLYSSNGPVFTLQQLRTCYFDKKNSHSQLISFADDTSVVIAGRNWEDFCLVSLLFRSHVIK